MFLALETGWSLDYIYQFDYDDFSNVMASLVRLKNLKSGGGSTPANSKRVSPQEFIKMQ